MSIQAVGEILDYSTTRGTDRLVLISIANHARESEDHPGMWEAWPGIATITREAGLDRERTVQDSLARLTAAGHVVRVIQGSPDARQRADKRTNLYLLPMLKPRGDASPHPVAHDGVTPPRTPPDPGTPVDNPQGGVTPHVTPPGSRGDASRHDGVTPHDITGCRRASPKPSVEPSMNQPPSSREPRGTAPDGDHLTGGQRSDQDPPRPLTADERRARIHQAVTILAERAADRARDVGKRGSYVGAVAERLAREHATAAHRLLAEYPDLPPVALADLLTDPDAAAPYEARARARQAAEDTLRRNRDTAAQPADRIRSAERARELRDNLRQPQETPTS